MVAAFLFVRLIGSPCYHGIGHECAFAIRGQRHTHRFLADWDLRDLPHFLFVVVKTLTELLSGFTLSNSLPSSLATMDWTEWREPRVLATERNQNRSDRRECTSAESTHNLFVSLASRGIARGGAIALRQRRRGKRKRDIYQLFATACTFRLSIALVALTSRPSLPISVEERNCPGNSIACPLRLKNA
jgi:hypothetical protein